MIEQVEGIYRILYKYPGAYIERDKGSFLNKLYHFEGECENFSFKKCVFRNEANEILIVEFEDIIQMSVIKDK